MTVAVDPELAYVTGVAHRLALSLATLVVDQMLPSESDVPFEPFTAALAVDRRVTATTLREVLGFEPSRRMNIGPGARFFERMSAAATERDDRAGEQVIAMLELVMRRTLGAVTQVYARGDSVVEVPFFVFGRLRGGPLVGLRSIAIET